MATSRQLMSPTDVANCRDDMVENLSRRPFSGFSAPSARHQIDIRPRLEQRVSRSLDAVDARNGVENDLLLLVGIVRGNGCQNDFSKRYQLTALRPADGRIIRDVALLCQLNEDAKPNRVAGHTCRDLIQKEVRRLRRGPS